MYRKDYILRLIDEFSRFLAVILGFKNARQFDQAHAAINEAAMGLLKVDLEALLQEDEQFQKLLSDGKRHPDELEVLAGLLKIKGEVYLETGLVISGIKLFEKALLLYKLSSEKSVNYSLEREKNIEELKIQLGTYTENH